MPYAIRLPLVLKTVVVHLLLPAALAISLGAAGGVVHADVLPPQMQDASESAAAAEAELTIWRLLLHHSFSLLSGRS